MPLSMIFTVICPSDTSGRRKGGLITMVFSFFGLPKYLSVKSERAFIHSFQCTYWLPTLYKAFFIQEAVLPSQWKDQHWTDFFDSMKNCSKSRPQIPCSRHSLVNLTLNSQNRVTITLDEYQMSSGSTKGWHVFPMQAFTLLKQLFLKPASHQTSLIQKEPKEDKSFDKG